MKLLFPACETFVSCRRNFCFMRGKLFETPGEKPVSEARAQLHDIGAGC